MTGRRLQPAEIRRLLLEAEQHFAGGRLVETENACRAILATAPDNPLANHYLGAVAFTVGQHEPALQLLRRATEIDPNVAAYFGTYAEALSKVGRFDEALTAIRRATALAPNRFDFQYHYGALAGKLGHVDESIAALKRSIQLKPDFPGAVNDLGLTLSSARRMGEALDCFRKALTINADYRTAGDNLVYYSHFADNLDGMAVRAEAERWAMRFAEPLKTKLPPPANDHSPDRRLRIGYVSPDLYEHPVGRFMQPVLAHHNRGAFEVFCYSDVALPDAMSQTLRQSCEHWIHTANVSDEALAQRIREDRIDVLIDLSLHMGHNRLGAFAQKPAPVQATYLAYAGTSGMSAMDWRISDPHLDPPAVSSVEPGNDGFYTERTLRLPRSYWCYGRPATAAQIGDVRPRDPTEPLTFACLNNIMKISDRALQAWAEILARTPASRMIIQGEPGEHLQMMLGFFERAGVDPGRIEFAAKRSLLDYFQLYHQVDIALDAFPYAGGTTTCDALWMGVPVVTMAGQIAVHRGGVSVLNNVGLSELVVTTIEQYVAAAIALANDSSRLTNLRSDLRRRMETSILMNPGEFVADLERAWRQIWKNWCGSSNLQLL